MVLSEAEAEARLRDLRRQRDALDRAITDLSLYLELGRRLGNGTPNRTAAERATDDRRGTDASSVTAAADDPAADDPAGEPTAAPQAAPAPVTGPPAKPDDPVEEGVSETVAARRYGRALIGAAVAVLAEAGRPLHVGEIETRLAARGFSVPGQQDPVAALNTRLWKRSGPGGPVRRLGDAVYALPDGGEPGSR